jgi:hypothetical protein
VLQNEVAGLNGELDELKEQWNEFKKPKNQEIFEVKQGIADKKLEYKYKEEKTKQITKEIKGVI